jgi:hypothetical protein
MNKRHPQSIMFLGTGSDVGMGIVPDNALAMIL